MPDDDRQTEILEGARDFIQREIRPYAGSFDESGVLPPALIEKMAAKGYLGASFPQEYGGLEMDPIHYGLLTEEVGKACCSTRALLTVQTSLVGESLLK